MECCRASQPKLLGYRKGMLSIWLEKGMFWVDQANAIRKNRWITEIELEEIEKNL